MRCLSAKESIVQSAGLIACPCSPWTAVLGNTGGLLINVAEFQPAEGVDVHTSTTACFHYSNSRERVGQEAARYWTAQVIKQTWKEELGLPTHFAHDGSASIDSPAFAASLLADIMRFGMFCTIPQALDLPLLRKPILQMHVQAGAGPSQPADFGHSKAA